MMMNMSPLAAHLGESLCSLRFATKVSLDVCVSKCYFSQCYVGEQHDFGGSKETSSGAAVLVFLTFGTVLRYLDFLFSVFLGCQLCFDLFIALVLHRW
jgi:hypothetical protein